MKYALIATLSALLLVVAGCARYQYGDKTYSNAEEMVQAAQAEFNESLTRVKPVDPRLGGRALIALPARTVIFAAMKEMNPMADSDSIDPIVEVIERDLLRTVEAVRKAAVFDDVTLLRSDNPEGALFDTYDHKLWLLMEGMSRIQWYLSRTGNANRETVTPDMGLSRLDQPGSFVLEIVRSGERLGATPIKTNDPK